GFSPISGQAYLSVVLSQTSNVAYAPGDRGGYIIYLLPASPDATAVPSRGMGQPAIDLTVASLAPI
ncbi:MAG: hypothetical protein PHV82_03860, partial [Victivallaceae bacterium]|nr:hypothetical protein [Victivallaceae bacterium]